MNTQLRQRFPRRKFEIANRIVALSRRRVIAREAETCGQEGQENSEDSDCWIHANDLAAVRLGFV